MILFCCLLLTTTTFSQEVLVEMPPNQGYIGVPMRFIVVYQNVESNEEPTLPPIDGFAIRRRSGLETSSQTTFVNGKITNSTSRKFTFYLTPQRIGTLVIPPLTFIADGKAFQTVQQSVEVIETPTSGALKVEVSGTTGDVYLGQPIDMTLKLYVERFTDPTLGVTLDAREMFSLMSQNSSYGMFSEALRDGRASVQTVQGETIEGVPTTFYVYSLQATKWPETTGLLEFDPISIIANYPISLARRNTGFLGGNSLVIDQSQLVSAQAKMPTIHVLTPPLQGRPEWYTGAVGQFDFRVVAEPTHVNVGEPITLTMRVTDLSSGPINLDYLSAPALNRLSTLIDYFKVPDKPLGGITEGRTKTFTQTIRPRRADVTEIPPLPMSSFDPITGTYITIWTKPIPVTVSDVATVSASDLIGGDSQSSQPKNQTLTEIDGGILANYTGDDLLESQTTEVTPLVLAAVALPPLMFTGVLVGLFYQRRSRTDASKLKFAKKNAIQTIRSGIQSNNEVQIHHIAQALRTIQADVPQQAEVHALLKRCDAAQFGGFEDESLLEDANKILETIS